MSDITAHIRSVLFQQIQVAVRVRLLEEKQSHDLYREHSRQIDKDFNKLHSNTISHQEDVAIQGMHVSYRAIQNDMNAIFADVYIPNAETRMQLLNPVSAQRMIGQFETQYMHLQGILKAQQDFLNQKLETWSNYTLTVIAVPLLLAFMLLLYARAVFRRNFLQPISTVIKDVQAISCGHLEARMQPQGVAEVRSLATAINKMASDLQVSQAALIESEKQVALGALVPVIAHNIRNPLASIRATAQILEDLRDQQDLEEAKQAIIDTTDRLSRWVNALVSYLHPLKPGYRLIQISKMLLAVLELLSLKIAERQLTVHKQDWHNDIELNVDPDLMEQAIYALLANAVEASPESGNLIIGLDKKATELDIYIEDQGSGLSFDPKPNQLTPGPSTKHLGTGLGIPIAFKICQHHGWSLHFDSNPSLGTKVTMTAPIRIIETGHTDADY